MKPEKIKQNSKRYFDRIADKNETIPEPLRCYEAVLEQLGSYEFTSLADISCGTGTMLSRICETYGEDKALYGVDLSPRSIDAAARKVGERVHLKEGDIDDIPLSDGCADIVLNMHSFHHYPDPLNALKELRRILKDGGRLLLVENDYSFLIRTKANLRHIRKRHKQGDVRMYSAAQLEKMIGRSGMKVEESRPIAEHSRLFICVKTDDL